MVDLPTGAVTFLFTDVVASTRKWADHPDDMRGAVERHDEIVRDYIEKERGYVFSTAGDSFAGAFHTPDEALAAAIGAQEQLGAEPWPVATPIEVRMGLHLGTASERLGDYFGPTVNLAARVEAAGHGGQILVTDVVRQACTMELHDLGVHQLRDITEPVRLWQVGDTGFEPLRTLDAALNTLPTSRTRIIGRDESISDVRAALETSRLVTLTGVGGCGKTRLAVEAAGVELHSYSGGVFFADLTTVDQHDAVWDGIASGIGLVSGADSSTQVGRFLAERHVLLVIDNCEQVLDGAAEAVDEILSTCPHVRVLATSREALDVEGERVVRVPSLTTGEGSPSARLFIERALAAGSNFAPADEDASVVAEICERLDGIPLAIELAAARNRSMSLVEIRDRLDDRFALLSGGRRKSRQRQQTLAGVVDWSHDLLDDDEKAMLRRLSVFQGGFDLDDVGPVTGFDSYEAADLVESLIARSLVDIRADDDGQPRRRLLETIRLYSLDKLVASGEAEETREAHYRHFCHSRLPRQLTEVLVDHDELRAQIRGIANIEAALAWGMESDRSHEAAGLAARTPAALMARGRSQAYRDLFLEDFDGRIDDAEAMTIALGGVNQATLRGDVEVVLHNVPILDRLRPTVDTGDAEYSLGYSLGIKGLFDAGPAYDEMCAIFDDPGRSFEDMTEVLLANTVGMYSVLLGRLDDAKLYYGRGFSALPDSAAGQMCALGVVWSAVLTGDTGTALAVVRGVEIVPGSYTYLPTLIGVVAMIGTEPTDAVAAALLDAVKRDVSGRITNQEGDYLAPFAKLRYDIGEIDRAYEIASSIASRTFSGPLVEILAEVEKWDPEDRAEIATGQGQLMFDPVESERRRIACIAMLAEEVEYWTDRLGR